MIDGKAEPAPIRATANAVGKSLHGLKYAIIGSAACVLLGSARRTRDVDVVVVRGGTAAARMALKNSKEYKFDVDARTRHTFYDDIPIDILAPPSLFKGEFTEDTPVVEVNGVWVLKPTLLLNCKCGSIRERADAEGKGKDAHDIKFLLRWLVANGCRLSSGTSEREEVSNVTKEFVDVFVTQYGEPSLWEAAGITFD